MLEFLRKDLIDENAVLKKRVAELTNVLDSIAAPMLVVDKDLTITFINDPALRAMGFHREEVLGRRGTERSSRSRRPVRRSWTRTTRPTAASRSSSTRRGK
jgi:PAS domain S-box-containing protein